MGEQIGSRRPGGSAPGRRLSEESPLHTSPARSRATPRQAMLRAAAVAILAATAWASSCTTFSWRSEPHTGASPVFINFTSVDGLVQASQINFVQGTNNWTVVVSAVFDKVQFTGVNLSYTTVGDTFAIDLSKGPSNHIILSSSASSPAWSLAATTVAAAAWVTSGRSLLAALAGAAGIAGARASGCKGTATASVTVYYPDSVIVQPLNSAQNTCKVDLPCVWVVTGSVSSAPTPFPTVSAGCFKDSNPPIFSQVLAVTGNMTVVTCQSLAREIASVQTDGDIVVGITQGTTCAVASNNALVRSLTPGVCNTTCPTTGEQCGGTDAYTVFLVETLAPSSFPSQAPTFLCTGCDCGCFYSAFNEYMTQGLPFWSIVNYWRDMVNFLDPNTLLKQELANILQLEHQNPSLFWSNSLIDYYTYEYTISQLSACPQCQSFPGMPIFTVSPSSAPVAATSSPSLSGVTGYLGCYNMLAPTPFPTIPSPSISPITSSPFSVTSAPVPTSHWNQAGPQGRMDILYQGDAASLEFCRDIAAAANHSFFGVINGNQCCGGDNLAFITEYGLAQLFNLPNTSEIVCQLERPYGGADSCQGNSGQLCGSSSAFALYAINSSYVATLQPTIAETTGQTYMGCFSDPGEYSLGASMPCTVSMLMSPNVCRSCCGLVPYFALTQGTTCTCFDSVPFATTALSSLDCQTPCGGDAKAMCGAALGALSLYASTPTNMPTVSPIVSQPSMSPIASQPSMSPIASQPSMSPIASQPSMSPIASQPSMSPIASQPSSAPHSTKPTKTPVTSKPSKSPTSNPSVSPSSSPTTRPTNRPATTESPTVCFAAHTTVELEDGTKVAMSHLRIGQRVLAVGHDGRLVYSPVLAFTGAFFNRSGAAVHVVPQGLKTLSLSPAHLLLASTGIEGDKPSFVQAADLRAGMYLWRAIEGVLRPVRVEHAAQGLPENDWITPLTAEGTLVANGLAASCHTGDHALARLVYQPFSFWLSLAPLNVGALPERNSMPWYTRWVRQSWPGTLVQLVAQSLDVVEMIFSGQGNI